MAKMQIGKGSIYTRYPNDTFRAGYDGMVWDSQKDKPAEWCGTRYAMVEPETIGVDLGSDDRTVWIDHAPDGWIDRTEEYHSLPQMGIDADSQE